MIVLSSHAPDFLPRRPCPAFLRPPRLPKRSRGRHEYRRGRG
ncbi:hypothetical protein D516_2590 [Rhodobacter sp. AKP1]|nr:hypothetical protein D516_2590 [Rhodobacter sp. AKP1]